MSCEHLLCARCSAPVVDGRCPICRAARDELHRTAASRSGMVLLVMVLLLAAVAAVVVGRLSG